MKLLTKALRAILPPLYSQEEVEDPVVRKSWATSPSWTGTFWAVSIGSCTAI
jgi:hypothetical protein